MFSIDNVTKENLVFVSEHLFRLSTSLIFTDLADPSTFGAKRPDSSEMRSPCPKMSFLLFRKTLRNEAGGTTNRLIRKKQFLAKRPDLRLRNMGRGKLRFSQKATGFGGKPQKPQEPAENHRLVFVPSGLSPSGLST